MKIITTKQTLASVMKKAAKIANPRATMPILSHVAIDFDGETCTITANDSARTYSERFKATGEPGQCAIDAGKLLRAVNGMATGDVELTDKQIKQGRSRLKLEPRNYADFPQPDYDDAQPCGLQAEQLAGIIAEIGHAIPQKDVRHMLNGLHLTSGNAVATDGHRMAWVDCGYEGPDLILPAESIRQMPEMSGQVMVSDGQVVIESADARYTTNLVDAKYPDWRRIIPKTFEATATVDSGALVQALKTAQIGGDKAKLTFGEGQCQIVNDNAESACDAECDAEVTVGFWMQYLIDAVSAADTETVTLGLNPSIPGCMVNDRFVVMPARF